MAKSKTAAPAVPEVSDQVAFLYHQDDAYILCRQRHDFPQFGLTKTGKMPRGIRAVGPYGDGSFNLIQTCRNCGGTRQLLTAPEGRLSLPGKWRRTYPDGYLSTGLGRISPRLAAEEGWRRINNELLSRATSPAKEED